MGIRIAELRQLDEQDTLLQNLWSGNHKVRERALLAVDAKDRDSVRKVAEVRQDTMLLVQVMFADLGFAAGHMRDDPSNQFWRRCAIRTLASTVDGMVYNLKRFALSSAKLTGAQYSPEEILFLSEEPAPGERLHLPGFRKHLKQTFRLFAKAFSIECPVDFGVKEFEYLCDTVDVRHRITHPKSFITFRVSDDEKKQAGRAIDWLSTALHTLLAAAVGKSSVPVPKTPADIPTAEPGR